MSDHDKVRVHQLDDKSDYSLWRIPVESACQEKVLTAALSMTESLDGIDKDNFAEKRVKVSGILVVASGDSALRVVRSVKGNPIEMLEKLDDRYDSKTTASKISKMVELVSLRYSSLRSDITKHVDRMASINEQLAAMKTIMDESLKVGILIASIETDEVRPVVAAIKTLADE